MNKNYTRPELEVKAFEIKERFAADINTSWGNDWDTTEENTDETRSEKNQ